MNPVNTSQETKIIDSFKKAALISSPLIILIGVLTEIGWQFNVVPLRSFSGVADSTSMNPVGAILFILIGFALQIIGRQKLNKFIWFAKAVGAIVLLIGLLKLGAIIFHTDAHFHFDQFIFRSKIQNNMISPNAALSFVLVGTALYLLAVDKYYRVLQFLALLAAIIALFGLFGYFYHATNLYGISNFTPLALNSAIAFLTASLTIMFIKPEKGYMKVFIRDSPGGKTARILLPSILFVPAVLDKILISAQNSGLIPQGTETPLHSVLVTVIFLAVIYWLTGQVDEIDFERRSINRVLNEEKTKAEAVLASIGDGVVVTDEDGRVILVNSVAQTLLGWHNQELVGKKIYESFDVVDDKGESIPFDKRPITIALKTGKKISTTTANTKYYYVRKDGTKFPVALTVAPVILNGSIAGAVDIFRDNTEDEILDKQKTEFVSLASHQLRTPLTAIRWNAELLQSNNSLPPNDRQYLQAIYDGTLRMISLVGSLLNVARLELGTFASKSRPIDLRNVVEAAVSDLVELSAKANVNISQTYGHDLSRYVGDDKVIKIIILNLLSNAVKYSYQNSEVTISVDYQPSGSTIGGRRLNTVCLVIAVADQGIGIPKDQQPRIFTKMFRADNAQLVQAEGTGLGLYIVKQVVEQSGGAVWFNSAENSGTTFYVVLPVSGMKQKTGSRTLD